MPGLSQQERQLIQDHPPFGLADQLLNGLADYDFDLDSVQHYDATIRGEIAQGVADLRSIKNVQSKPSLRESFERSKDKALHSDDPRLRDQAVWTLVASDSPDAPRIIADSMLTAPTQELKLSAMLALEKVAHKAPDLVTGVLDELARDAGDVEIAEWAQLKLHEMLSNVPGHQEVLNEAVSDRDFVYEKGRVFDTTMPLHFHCDAFTKVGPATLHTVVSPTWFGELFGQAMACVRTDTFNTNLVLEKDVPNLHPDGSAHYEHFPFQGTTTRVQKRVHRHNYWAQLYRPFYTSGRTELVTESKGVIRDMPMTFCRQAYTFTPARYEQDGPIPESVRGIYFGYGHIKPSLLLKHGLRPQTGDFQLTSRNNPETGKRANTYFYGTFFGKMSDWDGDGKLDVNTRPVHCSAEGHLDYRGDGTMQPDPFFPEDWMGGRDRQAPLIERTA